MLSEYLRKPQISSLGINLNATEFIFISWASDFYCLTVIWFETWVLARMNGVFIIIEMNLEITNALWNVVLFRHPCCFPDIHVRFFTILNFQQFHHQISVNFENISTAIFSSIRFYFAVWINNSFRVISSCTS